MRSAVLVTILALGLFIQPATAAESRYVRTELVTEMNRLKPLQNPKYVKAEEVLERRMLDRKNKVVGSVRDVILNDNGNISFLDVEFGKIQLSRPVFVNYGTMDIKPVSNGYVIGYDAKEIEDFYPTLLANIETAAGEEDSYALSKMKGMEIWTASGRRIGKVDDVLFTANGQRAEALYVGMTLPTMGGKAVAIPFGEADYSQASSARRIVVADTMGDAIISTAQDQ